MRKNSWLNRYLVSRRKMTKSRRIAIGMTSSSLLIGQIYLAKFYSEKTIICGSRPPSSDQWLFHCTYALPWVTLLLAQMLVLRTEKAYWRGTLDFLVVVVSGLFGAYYILLTLATSIECKIGDGVYFGYPTENIAMPFAIGVAVIALIDVMANALFSKGPSSSI